jgi:2-oxo-3-hexenedioate decarboxylase
MNLRAIADEIIDARRRHRQIAPLSGRVAQFDLARAYEVAALIRDARSRDGEVPVGRKIGFSNRALWPVFEVDQAVWGYLYDRTVIRLPASRGVLSIGSLLEPRIEPEIVIHLVSAPPREADAAAVLASVDWIAHGFEIVESIFPGWKFQAADTVAACAMHAALAIGEPQPVDRLGADVLRTIERFAVTLACDGELRERGTGANVLGSPLAAAAHLVAVLAQQPQHEPLAAGEIVTTGTLTFAPAIRPGETWSTTLDGIDLPGLTLKLED